MQVRARSCSTLCYSSLPGFLCPWNFPDKDTGVACGFLFQVNLLSPGIKSRCLALPTVPPGGADGKESACNAGDQGSYPWLGKNPLKRVWQPVPVFLLGESPWIEEPGRLQSMGSQRVRHDWATKLITAWAHTHTHTHTHIIYKHYKYTIVWNNGINEIKLFGNRIQCAFHKLCS